MTVLECPFGCGYCADFVRILSEEAQVFRCGICHKQFVVFAEDVGEPTKIYNQTPELKDYLEKEKHG